MRTNERENDEFLIVDSERQWPDVDSPKKTNVLTLSVRNLIVSCRSDNVCFSI